MASEEKHGNGSRPWITWVITILVGIAIAATGYAVSRVDKLQDNIQKEYVQKEDYHKDFRLLCERLSSLDGKLDSIDKILREHERESAKVRR